MAGAPVTELTPLGHALAGALGGVFSNATVYPLDTIKTRIQANKQDVKGKGKEDASRPTMTSLLLQIFKDEGLLGYYKGFAATMLNTFSTQYAYFFFYSTVRSSYIKRLTKKLPPGSPIPALSTAAELILGAVAGALAQIFTIPVSVIAVRQQVAHSKRKATIVDTSKKSFADAVKETTEETPLLHAAEEDFQDNSFFGVARKIVEEEGVTGLWLGLKPSLVLTVNPAITYGMFERIKTAVLAGTSTRRMTPWTAFCVGALSKTLATVVTYPYIMAKVRIQAGGGSTDESSLPKTTSQKKRAKSIGALQLLGEVQRKQGFMGWYQGMQAQIIKAVLSQAILFVSKDQFELYALYLMNIFYKLRASAM